METSTQEPGRRRGNNTNPLVTVQKIGKHKQKKEIIEHLPLGAKNFRWTAEQKEFMKKYVEDHQISSPSIVTQELKREGLDRGATLKQVRNFLKSHKKDNKIKAPQNSDPIDDIQNEMDCVIPVEDWDGRDLHQTVSFLSHLVSGDDAEKLTAKPGCTKRGKKYYLAALWSTAALCNQLWAQYETIEFSRIIDITEELGLKLEKLNFPFLGADGLGGIVNGGVLFPLGTITKNHHGRLLGCGMGHKEQQPVVHEVFKAFMEGFKVIQLKQGRDEEEIDAFLSALHISSDNATAIKNPVNQLVSELAHGTESSCSAHIHNDNLPKNKAKLNNRDNYSRVCGHVKNLQKFSNHAYGNIPWVALKQKWNSMNEGVFCKWFQEEHIDKNGNFRAGAIALEMPDDNNTIESMNEHKLKKMFGAAFRRENDKSRMPMKIAKGVQILVQELIPSFSKDTEKQGWFETDFETTANDRKLAKEYMMDPFLPELTYGVWCARFAGEHTAELSKSTARKALLLHKKAIEACLNEKEDEIRWSWKDFKLASSVVFTTADSCLCTHFLRKQMCICVMAVRQILGLDGLSIGAKKQGNDEILRSQRGGNKRQRNQQFLGIVADRTIEAEHNQAREQLTASRELRKRKREQKEEMKNKKRPQRFFQCKTCLTKVRTLQGLKPHCTLLKHAFVEEQEEKDDDGEDGNDGDDGGSQDSQNGDDGDDDRY